MSSTRRLSFRAVLGPEGLAPDRTLEIADGRITALREGGPPYDGFLALPGMPNAHSHAFQRALAGMGEEAAGDDSFWTWRDAMYRLAAEVTPEQLYDIARYGYAQMLRAGFTAVAEFHYLHHGREGERGPEMTHAVCEAAAAVGLPLSLFPVYYRTAGFDGSPARPGQRRFSHDSVEGFFRSVDGLGVEVAGLAPHSLRAVPIDDLASLVEGADARFGPESPLHIHVSEQVAEVEECRERFGATPIERLAGSVDLGPRWNLVHATHATVGEREAIRAAAATVVLCPITEAYLGDGIFEAREHRLAGGLAAVGSDANVRISAVEELRTLEYGQRLRDRQRARLAGPEGLGSNLWAWLAAGGAGAARTGTGRLAPGDRADLVVLDADGPAVLGHAPETALDAWLIGGDGRDIDSVWVGGERRVERGRVASEDEIAARFRAAMREIWAG